MKSSYLFLICVIILSGLGASFLYFTNIKPQQVKADCYKSAYSTTPRTNENNFEWAQEKRWMPKPGNQVADSSSYVWIYPDQSDTTQEGVNAAIARSQARKYQYNSCIHLQGY